MNHIGKKLIKGFTSWKVISVLVFVLVMIFILYSFAEDSSQSNDSNAVVSSEFVGVEDVPELRSEGRSVYNNVYENIVLENGYVIDRFETKKQLEEIGPGVNYDANRGQGNPNWQKSDTDFTPSTDPLFAFESTKNPLEIYVPQKNNDSLKIKKNNAHITFKMLNSTQPKDVFLEEENVVSYNDIFQDTDLIYTVSEGSLKEEIVIYSAEAPSEFQYLLNTQDCYVVDNNNIPITDSNSILSPYSNSSEIKSSFMTVKDEDSDKELFYINDCIAIDGNGVEFPLCLKVEDDSEGIILTYSLTADCLEKAVYPLTIDPSIINATNATTTYKSGTTYFINGTLIYNNISDLIIEGGAILKYNTGACLNIRTVTNFEVQGTEHNYAYFTSALDDSVGEDTDGIDGYPAEVSPTVIGSTSRALAFSFGTCTNIKIDYAKFRYFAYAIQSGYCSATNYEVTNSIFRDCRRGIHTENCSRISLIKNNLFTDIGDISFYDNTAAICLCTSLTVIQNNTINNVVKHPSKIAYGINLGGTSFTVKNNILSNIPGTGIYNTSTNPGSYLTNGFYKVTTRYNVNQSPAPTAIIQPTPGPTPFVSNCDAGRFLLVQGSSSTYKFLDSGTGTSIDNGLSNKTTTAPNLITTDVSESTTWSKVARDIDNVDLGYHYTPIDYVIKGTVRPEFAFTAGIDYCGIFVENEGTTLTINPGVVVAFSDSLKNASNNICGHRQAIYVTDDANIQAAGMQGDPIVFTSTLSSGDKLGLIEMQSDSYSDSIKGMVYGRNQLYDKAIHLYNGTYVGDPENHRAGQYNVIQHCDFYNSLNGIYLNVVPAYPIYSCRFYGMIADNQQPGVTIPHDDVYPSGIFINNPDPNANEYPLNINNNLFVNCILGGATIYTSSNCDVEFNNNTIVGGERGMWLRSIPALTGKIHNNTFYNVLYHGIIYYKKVIINGEETFQALNVTGNIMNNCFYSDPSYAPYFQDMFYIADAYNGLNYGNFGSIDADPLFVTPQNTTNIFDRYNLDQGGQRAAESTPSPCIDAGNTGYSKGPGGTVTDPSVYAYGSTDLEGTADDYIVDVGYHPVELGWDVSDSMVSLWTLDEPSGTAIADSIGEHDGTLIGGKNLSQIYLNAQNSLLNGGLRLNANTGDHDYINIPDHEDFRFGTGEFTIGAWIKLNTTTTSGVVPIISRYALGYTNGWILYTDYATNKVYFKIECGGQTYIAESYNSLAEDQWHFVVVERSGDLMEMYINGNWQATTGCTADDISSSSSASVMIGANSISSGMAYGNLSIDNVMIANRKWEEGEIRGVTYNNSGGLLGGSESGTGGPGFPGDDGGEGGEGGEGGSGDGGGPIDGAGDGSGTNNGGTNGSNGGPNGGGSGSGTGPSGSNPPPPLPQPTNINDVIETFPFEQSTFYSEILGPSTIPGPKTTDSIYTNYPLQTSSCIGFFFDTVWHKEVINGLQHIYFPYDPSITNFSQYTGAYQLSTGSTISGNDHLINDRDSLYLWNTQDQVYKPLAPFDVPLSQWSAWDPVSVLNISPAGPGKKTLMLLAGDNGASGHPLETQDPDLLIAYAYPSVVQVKVHGVPEYVPSSDSTDITGMVTLTAEVIPSVNYVNSDACYLWRTGNDGRGSFLVNGKKSTTAIGRTVKFLGTGPAGEGTVQLEFRTRDDMGAVKTFLATAGNLSKSKSSTDTERLDFTVWDLQIDEPSWVHYNFDANGDSYNSVSVPVKGSLLPAGLGTGTVEWTLISIYQTSVGSDGVSYRSIPYSPTCPDTATGVEGNVPFENIGGIVKLTAQADYLDLKSKKQTKYIYVSGSTIPPNVITSRLLELYDMPATLCTEKIVCGICFTESTYKQFKSFTINGINANWPTECYEVKKDGVIKVRKGEYIGLMQVPFSQSNAWNWKDNTQAGIDVWNTKVNLALEREDWQKGEHPDIRDLTPIERENMALACYGGFQNYLYIWNNNETNPDWMENPNCCKKDDNGNITMTGMQYVNTVRSYANNY